MILKRLVDLANKLDSMGHVEAADEIDTIIKNSGIVDWFKEKMFPKVECKCTCDKCNYANKSEKGGMGTLAILRSHCGDKGKGCGYVKKSK